MAGPQDKEYRGNHDLLERLRKCERKEKQTEAAAKRSAVEINKRNHITTAKAFECPYCHAWHVGNVK